VNKGKKKSIMVSHPENILELHGDLPFSRYQFVFAKIIPMDHCHCIDGIIVLSSKLKHVEHRIPTSRNILWHDTCRKAVSSKLGVPLWQEDGCQVLNHERKFA
jgi:hypothetical protein